MDSPSELDRRLETLKHTNAYQAYIQVREQVLRLKARQYPTTTAQPSAYWKEELANFEYMLDASPLIIEKLRHHCFHITGIRAYEYRSNRTAAERNLAARLDNLVELEGSDLLVAEPSELGGFGFNIGGQLHNIDTLKFFEALIALKRAGALDIFRQDGPRRTVCEIGSGWGGFAYQFKSNFPNTTYALVDFPELFLFAAVYLRALFPEAKTMILEDPSEPIPDDLDFLFIPNTLYESWRPEQLDLTTNLVSFQEMTTMQVQSYVDWAAMLKCSVIYSLNRDRSGYNEELTNVRDVMASRYSVRMIPMLEQDYTNVAPKPKGRAQLTRKLRPIAKRLLGKKSAPNRSYQHAVGILNVE